MRVGVPDADPPLRNPFQVRKALKALEHRVADAQAIPWPALAASWQRDLDAFREKVRARGWMPG